MAEAIRLGRMTDTMEEGYIAELTIKVGDIIKTGDTIAEVETDKATLPLESYFAGKILHVAAKKGDSLKIGDLIAIVGKEGEDFQSLLAAAPAQEVKPEAEKVAVKVEEKAAVVESAPVKTEDHSRVKASPLAKLIAKEKGINLASVHGSGEDGRIVKRDLENANTASMPSRTIVTTESFSDLRVSQMRKTIARRLGESKFSAPHFYLTMDINMDKAMSLRADLNEVLPQKVSFNDIVLKAVASAIRKNPLINTSWLGDTIRQYEHIHIGMAVAVEEGLLVPVIKFADQKSIQDISKEAKALAEKAGTKKLLPTEMEGSTFTVSNLGMFGIEEFTAIINPPDACILAVGGISEQAVVRDGKIEIGHIMKVTLSCDHRVVDGATGAQFLQTLKSLLEEPVRMLV